MNEREDPLMDNEDDPDKMLIRRLLTVENELKSYKEAYQIICDYLVISNTALKEVIESLPEPVLLREIAEIIEDPMFKQYIKDSATVFDYYKNILAENMEAIKFQKGEGI